MKKSIIISLFTLSLNIAAQDAPYDTLIAEIRNFYDMFKPPNNRTGF